VRQQASLCSSRWPLYRLFTFRHHTTLSLRDHYKATKNEFIDWIPCYLLPGCFYNFSFQSPGGDFIIEISIDTIRTNGFKTFSDYFLHRLMHLKRIPGSCKSRIYPNVDIFRVCTVGIQGTFCIESQSRCSWHVTAERSVLDDALISSICNNSQWFTVR
jgi:hypothetical protein